MRSISYEQVPQQPKTVDAAGLLALGASDRRTAVAVSNSTRSSWEWLPLIFDIIANLTFFIVSIILYSTDGDGEARHHGTPLTFTQYGVDGFEVHLVGVWNTMLAVFISSLIALGLNVITLLGFTSVSYGSLLQNSRYKLTFIESLILPLILVSALVEYETLDLYTAILMFIVAHVAELSKAQFDWDALWETPTSKFSSDVFTALWWGLLTTVVPIIFASNSSQGEFGPAAGASLIVLIVWYVIDSLWTLVLWGVLATTDKKLEPWMYNLSPFAAKRLSHVNVDVPKVDTSKLKYSAVSHNAENEAAHRMWSVVASITNVVFKTVIVGLLFAPINVQVQSVPYPTNTVAPTPPASNMYKSVSATVTPNPSPAGAKVLVDGTTAVSRRALAGFAGQFDELPLYDNSTEPSYTIIDGNQSLRAGSRSLQLLHAGVGFGPSDCLNVPEQPFRLELAYNDLVAPNTAVGCAVNYGHGDTQFLNMDAKRYIKKAISILARVKDRDIRDWPDLASKNGFCIINGEMCSRVRPADSFCHLSSPTGSGRACDDSLLVTPQSGCADINGWTASVAATNGISFTPNNVGTSPCVQPWTVIESLQGVSICPALNIYADFRPSANNFRGQRLGGRYSGVFCGFAPANRTTDECYRYDEYAAGTLALDTRLLVPTKQVNTMKNLPYRSRSVSASPVYTRSDGHCSQVFIPALTTPSGDRISVSEQLVDGKYAYAFYNANDPATDC